MDIKKQKRTKPLSPKELNDIMQAEKEVSDRIWLHRYLELNANKEAEQLFLGSTSSEGSKSQESPRAAKLRTIYGSEPIDDFELGMLHGKLSALRWVLTSKWDSFEV
jgi:hypothetical protein